MFPRKYFPQGGSAEVIPEGLFTVDADTPSALEGCEVRTKPDVARLRAGYKVVLNYTFKDPAGNPYDLQNSLGLPDGETDRVVAYFTNAACSEAPVYSVAVGIVDGPNGVISTTVPAAVRDNPGIYNYEIAVKDPDGEFILPITGMLMIEPSVLRKGQTPDADHSGWIELDRIRLRLRDYPELNTIFQTYEFDTIEILEAMRAPVEHWNEVSPPTFTYTPQNFPYKSHYIDAIISQLLMISARWYQRNSREISYAGGPRSDTRAKGPDYFAVATRMWEDYKVFVAREKYAQNLRTGMHIIGGRFYQ